MEKLSEHEGATVFEKKVVKTGQKRKRLEKGDPSDVDGYQGNIHIHILLKVLNLSIVFIKLCINYRSMEGIC